MLTATSVSFKYSIMAKISNKQKIRYRIRTKISGTATRPRLAVFRSNSDIYLQLINDEEGITIAAASTRDKDIAAQKVTKSEKSKLAGAAIARKATEIGIGSIVFDRGGNLYHGRVKAVGDGAREGGLQF
ncbi:50S ribosomal protein L18 [Rhizosphaericola mali]|jgi:large subunit ribosomal protein L18